MNDRLRPILLIKDNPMDVDLTLRTFQRGCITNPVEVLRDGQEALGWICRLGPTACRRWSESRDVSQPTTRG